MSRFEKVCVFGPASALVVGVAVIMGYLAGGCVDAPEPPSRDTQPAVMIGDEVRGTGPSGQITLDDIESSVRAVVVPPFAPYGGVFCDGSGSARLDGWTKLFTGNQFTGYCTGYPAREIVSCTQAVINACGGYPGDYQCFLNMAGNGGCTIKTQPESWKNLHQWNLLSGDNTMSAVVGFGTSGGTDFFYDVNYGSHGYSVPRAYAWLANGVDPVTTNPGTQCLGYQPITNTWRCAPPPWPQTGWQSGMGAALSSFRVNFP